MRFSRVLLLLVAITFVVVNVMAEQHYQPSRTRTTKTLTTSAPTTKPATTSTTTAATTTTPAAPAAPTPSTSVKGLKGKSSSNVLTPQAAPQGVPATAAAAVGAAAAAGVGGEMSTADFLALFYKDLKPGANTNLVSQLKALSAKHKIPEEDLASIVVYTTGAYEHINTLMRDPTTNQKLTAETAARNRFVIKHVPLGLALWGKAAQHVRSVTPDLGFGAFTSPTEAIIPEIIKTSPQLQQVKFKLGLRRDDTYLYPHVFDALSKSTNTLFGTKIKFYDMAVDTFWSTSRLIHPQRNSQFTDQSKVVWLFDISQASPDSAAYVKEISTIPNEEEVLFRSLSTFRIVHVVAADNTFCDPGTDAHLQLVCPKFNNKVYVFAKALPIDSIEARKAALAEANKKTTVELKAHIAKEGWGKKLATAAKGAATAIKGKVTQAIKQVGTALKINELLAKSKQYGFSVPSFKFSMKGATATTAGAASAAGAAGAAGATTAAAPKPTIGANKNNPKPIPSLPNAINNKRPNAAKKK